MSHTVNSDYNHIEDSQLLSKYYADLDSSWLGILLPRYTLLLFGVCMKYLKNEGDARDAVQQVFLKIISELHKYKVEYFKSWIYMVAKNHCLLVLRARGKGTLEVNDKILAAEDIEEADKAGQEHDLDQLEIAIGQLNDAQRKCIRLFYLEKQSYAEVAASTGYTMLQIKSHIQNGKRNLRLMLEQPNLKRIHE